MQRGVRTEITEGLVGVVSTEKKVEKHERAIAMFSSFEYVR
jgi:hypothetical protein